jgi:hypothetical protein
MSGQGGRQKEIPYLLFSFDKPAAVHLLLQAEA